MAICSNINIEELHLNHFYGTFDYIQAIFVILGSKSNNGDFFRVLLDMLTLQNIQEDF